MNKLYVKSILPDGYGVGVMPTMEKPAPDGMSSCDYHWAFNAWNEHLDSLPTYLIHPSLHPQAGKWIEKYREGFEIFTPYGGIDANYKWVECSAEVYKEYETTANTVRKVLLSTSSATKEPELFYTGVMDNNGVKEMMTDWQPDETEGKEDVEEAAKKYANKWWNGENKTRLGFKAGAQWASLPSKEQSMKWVKASERLPEPDRNKFIKYGGSLMAIGIYRSYGAPHWQSGWFFYGGMEIPEKESMSIEWLEELQ